MEYHEKYESFDVKKVVIRGVPRKVLLRPEDAVVRLNYQTFSLGDRVIYVCDTGSVPIGNKGTVVGVDEKTIDIVFDTTFMGGVTLSGRCSEFRGANLPYSNVINISNPSHQNTCKVDNSATARNNNYHNKNSNYSNNNKSDYRGGRGGGRGGGGRGNGRGNGRGRGRGGRGGAEQ